jgi:uncharacterized protein YdhG (YjbR/CyaY superfamily)
VINNLTLEIKILLEQTRVAIKQVAPQSTEAIKNGMPAFVE